MTMFDKNAEREAFGITSSDCYVNPDTCTIEEVAKEKHILFRYIRAYPPFSYNQHPVGVFLALLHPVEPVVTFGISLCHKDDKFDKLTGVRLAIKRALCPMESYSIYVPLGKRQIDFQYGFDAFVHAVGRYFKGCPMLWPNNINIIFRRR